MLDKPVRLYPDVGQAQVPAGAGDIYGNGDIEPTIPVIAGTGSRVMLRFQSPALSSYRMVQVGAGAASYGTVTLNLANGSGQDVQINSEEDEKNHLSDYYTSKMKPDFYTINRNAPKVIKEGEPLIINPVGVGRAGQTVTLAGRTQADEGFTIDTEITEDMSFMLYN